MGDGFDTTATQSGNVAFCQDCGTPLTAETIRRVGTGVFCEPCLEQRLGTAPQAGAPYAGSVPPARAVPPGGLPNPSAAGWLALIPGAGAFLNGQYAKGLIIFLIFMMLSSLGDSHSVFGLAALAFYIFQIVDAYQTAKARILGTPLPNPFGLNDLGDRMGFGKNWPGSMENTAPSAGPVHTAPANAAGMPVGGPVPPVPPANWAGYVPPQHFAQSDPGAWSSPYQSPYQTPPVTAAYAPVNPQACSRRFPMAAIVLILLGLFALSNSFLHLEINGSWIAALVLGVFGVWGLIHRLQQVHRDHPQGSDAAVLWASVLRGPAVLMIVLAVLFVLQGAQMFTLGQTWPVIVITVGLVLLLQRVLDRVLHANDIPLFYAGSASWAGGPPQQQWASPSTATVAATTPPTTQDDVERGGPQ
ncbi:MAG: hypothetical protein ABI142_08975 [Bryocella sp.]